MDLSQKVYFIQSLCRAHKSPSDHSVKFTLSPAGECIKSDLFTDDEL